MVEDQKIIEKKIKCLGNSLKIKSQFDIFSFVFGLGKDISSLN